MTKQRNSFRAWTRLFSTEDACLKLLAEWRWRNGYACPKCGHNESCTLSKRQLRQCNKCQHQVSPTVGTALNHVRIPLPKWFAGAYMINAYKDTMTLEVLRIDLDISWRSASRLSKSVQRAMEDPVLSGFLKSQLLAHGIAISNKETDSFRAWTRLFSTEDACLKLLGEWRWRNGYACPKCGHNESCTLSKRQLRQCNKCQHQVSPTAGTALNHVRIPLPKWFAGAYMINAYKDTMTLEVLRKELDISWRSASRLSKSVQRAMADPVLSDFLKSQLLTHGIQT